MACASVGCLASDREICTAIGALQQPGEKILRASAGMLGCVFGEAALDPRTNRVGLGLLSRFDGTPEILRYDPKAIILVNNPLRFWIQDALALAGVRR